MYMCVCVCDVLVLACVIAVLVSVALTAFYLTSVLVTFVARPMVLVQFRFALTASPLHICKSYICAYVCVYVCV